MADLAWEVLGEVRVAVVQVGVLVVQEADVVKHVRIVLIAEQPPSIDGGCSAAIAYPRHELMVFV